MATINVTDDSFKADVLDSETPVLVDFWAEWCGPCKMIAPALEELSEEFAGQVKIAKVDIVDNTDIATDLGIQGIPYLAIYKGGELVAEQKGAGPKSQLKSFIEGAL